MYSSGSGPSLPSLQYRRSGAWALPLLLLAALVAPAVPGTPFQASSLLVLRARTTSSSVTGALEVDEYRPSDGALLQALPLPSSGTSPCTLTAFAHEGYLAPSSDGTAFYGACYGAPAGVTYSGLPPGTPKYLFSVSSGGVVSTGNIGCCGCFTYERVQAGAALGGSVAGAPPAPSGAWLLGGGSLLDGGLRYVSSSGIASDAGTGIQSTYLGGAGGFLTGRALALFNGQLYVSMHHEAPYRGVMALGSGAPTAPPAASGTGALSSQGLSVVVNGPATGLLSQTAGVAGFWFESPSRVWVLDAGNASYPLALYVAPAAPAPEGVGWSQSGPRIRLRGAGSTVAGVTGPAALSAPTKIVGRYEDPNTGAPIATAGKTSATSPAGYTAAYCGVPGQGGCDTAAATAAGGRLFLYIADSVATPSRVYRVDTVTGVSTAVLVMPPGTVAAGLALPPLDEGLTPAAASASPAASASSWPSASSGALGASPSPTSTPSAGAATAPVLFSSSSILAMRVGSPAAAGATVPASDDAAPVYLDEIDPSSGAVLRTVALPSSPDLPAGSAAGGGFSRGARCTLSTANFLEGLPSLSADGKAVVIACYDAPVPTPGPADGSAAAGAGVPLGRAGLLVADSAAAAVPRVIARVTADGRVDVTHRVSGPAFTSAVARSATMGSDPSIALLSGAPLYPLEAGGATSASGCSGYGLHVAALRTAGDASTTSTAPVFSSTTTTAGCPLDVRGWTWQGGAAYAAVGQDSGSPVSYVGVIKAWDASAAPSGPSTPAASVLLTLPIGGGTSAVPNVTFSSQSSPVQPVFQSSSTLWLTDNRGSLGGRVYRYTFQPWAANGKWGETGGWVPPDGFSAVGLAGRTEASSWTLYVTTVEASSRSYASSLYRFVPPASLAPGGTSGSAAGSAGGVWTLLVRRDSSSVFRGVVLPPADPARPAASPSPSPSASPAPSVSATVTPSPAAALFSLSDGSVLSTSATFLAVRVGSSSFTSTSTSPARALPVTLEEVESSSGTLLASLPLPTNASTVVRPGGSLATSRRCTLPASPYAIGSDGFAALSGDGRLVSLACYDADPDTPVSSTTPHVSALLDILGRGDFFTSVTSSLDAGFVSTVTDNGTAVWSAGAGTVAGLRLTAARSSLADSAVTLLSTQPASLRVAAIYGGALYVSSGGGVTAAAPPGLYVTSGVGLPYKTASVSLVPFVDPTSSVGSAVSDPWALVPDPWAFVFEKPFLVWVADTRNASIGNVWGYVQGPGAVWVEQSVLSIASNQAIYGLTGTTLLVPSSPADVAAGADARSPAFALFAASASTLYKVIPSSGQVTVLRSAPAGASYRSVVLPPSALPRDVTAAAAKTPTPSPAAGSGSSGGSGVTPTTSPTPSPSITPAGAAAAYCCCGVMGPACAASAAFSLSPTPTPGVSLPWSLDSIPLYQPTTSYMPMLPLAVAGGGTPLIGSLTAATSGYVSHLSLARSGAGPEMAFYLDLPWDVLTLKLDTCSNPTFASNIYLTASCPRGAASLNQLGVLGTAASGCQATTLGAALTLSKPAPGRRVFIIVDGVSAASSGVFTLSWEITVAAPGAVVPLVFPSVLPLHPRCPSLQPLPSPSLTPSTSPSPTPSRSPSVSTSPSTTASPSLTPTSSVSASFGAPPSASSTNTATPSLSRTPSASPSPGCCCGRMGQPCGSAMMPQTGVSGHSGSFTGSTASLTSSTLSLSPTRGLGPEAAVFLDLPPGTTALTVDTCASPKDGSSFDTLLYVTASCPRSTLPVSALGLLGSNDDGPASAGCGTFSALTLTLPPGVPRVYVVVDGAAANQKGSFVLRWNVTMGGGSGGAAASRTPLPSVAPLDPGCLPLTVIPSATPSSSVTPSLTPSSSPSPSITGSRSPTASITPSASPAGSSSGSPSHTPSLSPSPSLTPSGTPTASVTPTPTPSLSSGASVSPSSSAAGVPSGSPTPSASSTPSSTGSVSGAASPQGSSSGTPSASAAASGSSTASPTGTASASAAATGTASGTPSTSPSLSTSRSLGASAAPTSSITSSSSSTPTVSGSSSASVAATTSASATSSGASSPSPSSSGASSPSPSSSGASSPSPSSSGASSPSPSSSVAGTVSPSSTGTGSPSMTSTASGSPTATASASVTTGASGSATASGTPAPSFSPTSSGTPSGTVSAGATVSSTVSATPSPTGTLSNGATATTSGTRTPSSSATGSGTASVSASGSITGTPSGSPSRTPAPTGSASGTSSATPSMSASGSITPSTTASGTGTASSSITPSISGSPSRSSSVTPSGTPSSSGSPSRSTTTSATPSATPSTSPSGSVTVSASATPSLTPSISRSASSTPTGSGSTTRTPSVTGSASRSASLTPSVSASPSRSGSTTPTTSGSPSVTPSSSTSSTPSSSVSSSTSVSTSATPSMTPSPSTTASSSVTPSITPSVSPPPLDAELTLTLALGLGGGTSGGGGALDGDAAPSWGEVSSPSVLADLRLALACAVSLAWEGVGTGGAGGFSMDPASVVVRGLTAWAPERPAESGGPPAFTALSAGAGFELLDDANAATASRTAADICLYYQAAVDAALAASGRQSASASLSSSVRPPSPTASITASPSGQLPPSRSVGASRSAPPTRSVTPSGSPTASATPLAVTGPLSSLSIVVSLRVARDPATGLLDLDTVDRVAALVSSLTGQRAGGGAVAAAVSSASSGVSAAIAALPLRLVSDTLAAALLALRGSKVAPPPLPPLLPTPSPSRGFSASPSMPATRSATPLPPGASRGPTRTTSPTHSLTPSRTPSSSPGLPEVVMPVAVLPGGGSPLNSAAALAALGVIGAFGAASGIVVSVPGAVSLIAPPRPLPPAVATESSTSGAAVGAALGVIFGLLAVCVALHVVAKRRGQRSPFQGALDAVGRLTGRRTPLSAKGPGGGPLNRRERVSVLLHNPLGGLRGAAEASFLFVLDQLKDVVADKGEGDGDGSGQAAPATSASLRTTAAPPAPSVAELLAKGSSKPLPVAPVVPVYMPPVLPPGRRPLLPSERSHVRGFLGKQAGAVTVAGVGPGGTLAGSPPPKSSLTAVGGVSSRDAPGVSASPLPLVTSALAAPGSAAAAASSLPGSTAPRPRVLLSHEPSINALALPDSAPGSPGVSTRAVGLSRYVPGKLGSFSLGARTPGSRRSVAPTQVRSGAPSSAASPASRSGSAGSLLAPAPSIALPEGHASLANLFGADANERRRRQLKRLMLHQRPGAEAVASDGAGSSAATPSKVVVVNMPAVGSLSGSSKGLGWSFRIGRKGGAEKGGSSGTGSEALGGAELGATEVDDGDTSSSGEEDAAALSRYQPTPTRKPVGAAGAPTPQQSTTGLLAWLTTL